MKKNQLANTTENTVTANAILNKKAWIKRDIVLNVGFQESMIRGFITIFIPWPLLAINHNLLIYAAPVMFYLFVTALTHFCFIRYAWQHWIKHMKTAAICNFATDLNIPVEAV
ncbi:hypothetical protein GCM10027036_34520 [Flavihumibacter cheonanensis]|jgi:hypothetical protein|uniref:Uncharacterized protein n=1 Tax=Flavihumibacter stibioxidans TaxID=1834163 RepID=A0ABR7M766_9BACT|nr:MULTISPECIES: hypothetical protein [Chitinophagaceae]MBC6490679.1 hypothetical protein [Flavihumibacter stibioxidans]MCG7754829.1 hypothetical protein [Flavihumibacter cheonanensis]BDQ12092.1 hypothetical protein TEGAF0_13090 [Sediminibacterium sp. TEGAF015]